jgi:tRNA(Ile)-lysidine synthase TilS/MesJ
MVKAPSLFEMTADEVLSGDSPAASKSVIDKLLKVRRSLDSQEQRFALPKINLLIEELRSLTRATPTQREEMVLYAVERQGATTETEIAEDTRLHRSVVREMVQSLFDKNILYQVSRTVIGSGRPQFAIKSNRAKMPEATTAIHDHLEPNFRGGDE